MMKSKKMKMNQEINFIKNYWEFMLYKYKII